MDTLTLAETQPDTVTRVLDWTRKLLHLRKTRVALEKKEAELKAMLASAVTVHLPLRVVFGTGKDVMMAVREKEFVDAKKLRAEYPDIYAKVVTTSRYLDIREVNPEVQRVAF